MTKMRILVPVDFSSRSSSALKYAALLAREAASEVTVLHAWDCPPFARHVQAASGSDSPISLADLIVRNAERELEQFIAAASLPDGLVVHPLLIAASPTDGIMQASRSGEYDLVVMSTRGRGALASAVLGSVARRVLEFSPAPVIFVPERWTQVMQAG
jgi:nucleotide-binding universal stress UspA family protein